MKKGYIIAISVITGDVLTTEASLKYFSALYGFTNNIHHAQIFEHEVNALQKIDRWEKSPLNRYIILPIYY